MCCWVAQNSYHTVADMRITFVDGTTLDTADPESRKAFLEVRALMWSRLLSCWLDHTIGVKCEVSVRMAARAMGSCTSKYLYLESSILCAVYWIVVLVVEEAKKWNQA